MKAVDFSISRITGAVTPGRQYVAVLKKQIPDYRIASYQCSRGEEQMKRKGD